APRTPRTSVASSSLVLLDGWEGGLADLHGSKREQRAVRLDGTPLGMKTSPVLAPRQGDEHRSCGLEEAEVEGKNLCQAVEADGPWSRQVGHEVEGAVARRRDAEARTQLRGHGRAA